MGSERLVAPGNDYRGLRSRPDMPTPSVTVVIPVYNRPELLANVLAALTLQTTRDFDVVVVDDGSDDEIGPAVELVGDALTITLLRQERLGFGTHRARNLAVEHSDADVIAFLDADCIPSGDWLERHIYWHRKATNVVVTGSRRHIDRRIDPGRLLDGAVDLHAIASRPERETDPFEPDDWRRVTYRRSQRLLLGDGAYRAVIGGNSSMRREAYLEVGGTSEDFTGWGGEDTELAWRLWNAGMFIVPENRAIIYHQTALDPAGAAERRRDAGKRALPLVADRVPHRFYRKEPSHLHTVPRVSWIVTAETGEEAAEAWSVFSRLSYLDTELILLGDDGAVGNWASTAAVSRDLSIAETFGEAVVKSRGEVVAIVDARARFDRRLLARAMRRYNDPRTTAVRVAYRAGDTRILRLRDLRMVDDDAGRLGLPFFALISRRELMKDRDALDDSAAAWNGALARSRIDLLMTDPVDIPVEAGRGRREKMPGPAEARAAGIPAVTRELRQSIGSRRTAPPRGNAVPRPSETAGDHPPDPLVGIEYVGLAGHQNLGDDAMLEAVRRSMPWAEIGTDVDNPQAVMVGGGTLFNADGYYLNKVRRVDGPNLERIVYGTGMRSEAYWGRTEQFKEWEPFLNSAVSVGLRGPDSLAAMRAWGYGGPAEVIGDPALCLERPDGVESIDGRVVLCPLHTGGECWGGDDFAVFDEFARTIARLRAEGRDVVMMTAHPADDRWAIEIMRRAGVSDLEYVPGYEDLDRTLKLLASADLVVGERLHAVVLAAAVGTPFVAVEYRPKVRDFMRSVGADDAVVRTDEMDRLQEAIERRLVGGETVDEAVAELRVRLRERAGAFARILGVGAVS